MYFETQFNSHIYLITLLILTAVCGDYLTKHSKFHLYRAVFDNVTHAIIGALSWCIVSTIHRSRYASQTLAEIAICMVIAACIDLDHFVVARSFYLKDATNLKNRPPLHCTTLPLILMLVFMPIAYIQGSKWIIRLLFIVLTAFISHHCRDAARRGFWLYPWGSTKPISYFAYICFTIIIPYIVSILMKYMLMRKPLEAPIIV